MNSAKNRGSVLSVFFFCLPVIVSQACDSLMMLTDRYLLSQVDPVSPAASMTGGMTAFLLWIFGAGLLGFITALVSQYRGAGDFASASAVVPQGLFLALILAAPILLFGNDLGHAYFSFLRVPALELPLALDYLSIMKKACFFVFAKVVFASFFSGAGKTKNVMIVNIIGLCLNIPLSYFFIHGGFGEAWSGVRGAALGTVLAEIVMTLIYALLFFSTYAKGLSWSLNKSIMGKILKYGTPTGLEFFALTFAFNTFLTMFHSFGIEAAQAITVAMNWSWLTVLPFFGLNVGLMSLVGHAMGEGKPLLAAKITKSGLIIALGILGFASCGFLLFSENLVDVFATGMIASGREMAILMVRTLPLYCLFDGLSFVLTATLRASGDAKFCLKVGAVGQWLCLALCYFGTYYGGFAWFSIWNLFILALFGQAIAYLFRYQRGGWQELSVVEARKS